MNIRRADEKDIARILELLSLVLEVHAKIRPDYFVSGTTKYSKEELKEIVTDDNRPVFIAADENNEAMGYAFCVMQKQGDAACLVPFTSLYIDDLCVFEKYQGKGVAEALFKYVKQYAKDQGCYEVTLNVWTGNDRAKAFYEKMGLKPLKTYMEYIL